MDSTGVQKLLQLPKAIESFPSIYGLRFNWTFRFVAQFSGKRQNVLNEMNNLEARVISTLFGPSGVLLGRIDGSLWYHLPIGCT